ncbi:sigma-70 family RNA polymerase sigma factor [Mediterraneibacter sp. HCN-7094]
MNTYNKIPDEQLICRLRNGEDEIMDYLMIKYKSMVRRKARAMYLIGGDNDDLIQEGMIGLIKAVRDFDSEAGQSFSSFAELCVSRQMYSAIASSKRKKHIPLNSYVSLYDEGNHEDEKALPLIDTIEPEVENNPETLYFGKESSEAFIEELKENLSDLENRVLYLHMLGTNYRDIANLLDKSPKTIDNALQRIRTKAGKLLSQ